MPKVKKEKVAEPYWQELVELYFDFCKKRFNEVPSFDGSSPRDLKSIIQSLRKRAESAQIEWTPGVARTRLRRFLEFAVADDWLSRNFLLSNLNRQKDKIFFTISSQRQYLAR